ncbi:hypothetical protein [Anabaena subtropica]|nr:hypothetical protein [Anabaena subtropica]
MGCINLAIAFGGRVRHRRDNKVLSRWRLSLVLFSCVERQKL